MQSRKERKERVRMLTQEWLNEALIGLRKGETSEQLLERFHLFCKIYGIDKPQDSSLREQILVGVSDMLREKFKQEGGIMFENQGYEVEIIGKHLTQRFVPLEEQYKKYTQFRRIRVDGHLITLGFSDKVADRVAPRHKIYELVSIWHPLDPKYKCSFREELLATSQLKKLIKDEIAKGGIVKHVYRYWLEQKPPAIPPERREEFPEYRKVAVGDVCSDKADIYKMTFDELLTAAEKGELGFEAVESEFDGMAEENLEPIAEEADINKLKLRLEYRKKELAEAEERLKTETDPGVIEILKDNIAYFQRDIRDLERAIAKAEKELLRKEIRPEVEREFKSAVKPVLEKYKDTLGQLKMITIKPTDLLLGKDGVSFKWHEIETRQYVVVLKGQMPQLVGKDFKLKDFKVAIEGGQPAAMFVANLHNALLRLKAEAKLPKEVDKYLDSIQNKRELTELSRQHWLRDIRKDEAGRYIGSLRNLIWKNLPQPFPENLDHPANWIISDLMVTTMPEYTDAMNKALREYGIKTAAIQNWLAEIGYKEEVKWTEATQEEITEIDEADELEELETDSDIDIAELYHEEL